MKVKQAKEMAQNGFHFHFLSQGVPGGGRPLRRGGPRCFCIFFQTAAVHHSGPRAAV